MTSLDMTCRVCGVGLTVDNTCPSYIASRKRLCRSCDAKRQRVYQIANREKVNASRLRRKRERDEQIRSLIDAAHPGLSEDMTADRRFLNKAQRADLERRINAAGGRMR